MIWHHSKHLSTQEVLQWEATGCRSEPDPQFSVAWTGPALLLSCHLT